jgi:hypothetical protein
MELVFVQVTTLESPVRIRSFMMNAALQMVMEPVAWDAMVFQTLVLLMILVEVRTSCNYDLVCNGKNECVGCDGIPYSGATLDICGVCNGDDSTCRQEDVCNRQKTCMTCTQLKGRNGQTLCAFCLDDNSCHDPNFSFNCKNVSTVCADNVEKKAELGENLTSNTDTGSSTYVYSSAIGGLIIAGAIAGGLIYAQRRHIKNTFDGTIWADTGLSNPIYKDRTIRVDNPLYQKPGERRDDDDE